MFQNCNTQKSPAPQWPRRLCLYLCLCSGRALVPALLPVLRPASTGCGKPLVFIGRSFSSDINCLANQCALAPEELLLLFFRSLFRPGAFASAAAASSSSRFFFSSANPAATPELSPRFPHRVSPTAALNSSGVTLAVPSFP